MRIRPITRGGQGGDAVYCAAYRGGRVLWNERTGDLHKHDGREDVRDTGIVLPQVYADDPEYQWAKDPYRLWNTAEFTEVQHNARVARDYTVVLPSEMTQEQRREVVYRFAQFLSDRYGNAIDVALHDARPGRARHYHAHLLATTRQIAPEGLLEKTDAELVGYHRTLRGLHNSSPQEYALVRRTWDGMLQHAAKEAGLPHYVCATLYREYGEGETTAQYQKRVMQEGFDLRKQQREDRQKTVLTQDERQESAQKKWAIRKYEQQQYTERRLRKNATRRELRAGRAGENPDRNKRLWVPRWEAQRGLLENSEQTPEFRLVGQTAAMRNMPARAPLPHRLEKDYVDRYRAGLESEEWIFPAAGEAHGTEPSWENEVGEPSAPAQELAPAEFEILEEPKSEPALILDSNKEVLEFTDAQGNHDERTLNFESSAYDGWLALRQRYEEHAPQSCTPPQEWLQHRVHAEGDVNDTAYLEWETSAVRSAAISSQQRYIDAWLARRQQMDNGQGQGLSRDERNYER